MMTDKTTLTVAALAFLAGLSLLKSPFLGLVFLLGCAGFLTYRRSHHAGPGAVRRPEAPDDPPDFVKEEAVDGSSDTTTRPLTREYKGKIRLEVEQSILHALNDVLEWLRATVPCHTAAFFRRGKTDSVYLFLYSSESRDVALGEAIAYGAGLVGQVMKDREGRLVHEGDIRSPSTTLQYYSADQGIRTFLGVPITVEGVCRGALVADAKAANAFTDEMKRRVELAASIAGAIQYYAYLQLENRIDRNKVTALSVLQRDFFKLSSEQEIINKLGEILEAFVQSSRVTISLSDARKGYGRVAYASGADAEFFREYRFPFSEKGLISLVFEKNAVVKRKFEAGRYTPRFSVREKVNAELMSILAVPVPSSSGEAVMGAVALESVTANHYSQIDLENLQNLANATGLALEKIRMLDTQTQLATMDGLTALPNHRQFQNALEASFKRARRQNSELAVVMADIDFFKKVNDTYGHPVGDLILKGVAEILRGLVRKDVDQVARYGGEEFACILESGEAMALETAERIRAAVEKTSFEIGGNKQLNVTMSFGVAVFPADASKKSLLLERADKALYEAKKNGRNQVKKY